MREGVKHSLMCLSLIPASCNVFILWVKKFSAGSFNFFIYDRESLHQTQPDVVGVVAPLTYQGQATLRLNRKLWPTVTISASRHFWSKPARLTRQPAHQLVLVTAEIYRSISVWRIFSEATGTMFVCNVQGTDWMHVLSCSDMQYTQSQEHPTNMTCRHHMFLWSWVISYFGLSVILGYLGLPIFWQCPNNF